MPCLIFLVYLLFENEKTNWHLLLSNDKVEPKSHLNLFDLLLTLFTVYLKKCKSKLKKNK